MGLFDNTAFNPYGYMAPYQRPIVPNPPQINVAQPQQSRDLEKVNGIESARQYQMPPNSRVALFDTNDDIFYVRETDASGFPTIRAFRFVEVQDAKPDSDQPQYITREEFNKFKEEVLNGQQPVQFKSDYTSGKSKSGKSKANDATVQGVKQSPSVYSANDGK